MSHFYKHPTKYCSLIKPIFIIDSPYNMFSNNKAVKHKTIKMTKIRNFIKLTT